MSDSAYTQLAGSNTFTGNQTVNGAVSATTFVGDGSALTGVSRDHERDARLRSGRRRKRWGHRARGRYDRGANDCRQHVHWQSDGKRKSDRVGRPHVRWIADDRRRHSHRAPYLVTLNIGFSPLKAGACAVLGSVVTGVSAEIPWW